MDLILKAIICFSALSLFGCALSSQPKRPDNPGIATLELPITMDLVSVNGQAMSTYRARGNPHYHTLAPGQHQLEVGYTEYWGNPLAGELVRSDVYVINLTVQPDTVYQLEHTSPGAKRIINASRFLSSFGVWALEQRSGQRTDGVFSRKYTGLLGLLKGPSAGATDAAESTTEQVGTIDRAESVYALDQLKLWWQRASKKERGEFLIWSTGSN